tara:strand:- start:10731 stop:11267 length:537 start_codon:yes stop_codon:yes gene_type:complete
MATDLHELIFIWQDYGFFDILLPFLLIFTLTFAVLQKTHILGSKSKNLNIVVALVLGLLFLQNTFLLASLQNFLPNVSFFIVGILMFLLIVGVIMGDQFTGGFNSVGWATGIALVALLWALFSEPGFEYTNFQDIFYGFFGTEALPIVLFILVVIAVIVIGLKSGDNEDTPTPPPAGP